MQPSLPPLLGQSGYKNENPASLNRPGMTLLLFKINSDSVRNNIAPTSTIQGNAGNPIGCPQVFRSAAMKSRFGTGWGAARFTVPVQSSCSINQSTARTKSASWIHETNWLPDPCRPPNPQRTNPRNTSNAPPLSGLNVIALRSATLRTPGIVFSKKAASQLFATSIEKFQVSGAPFSFPPSSPVVLSISRSNACR